MNDLRELLPLAAKAMGIEGVLTNTIGGSVCIVDKRGNSWRPHLDSGDGAEMEDKLWISVSWVIDRNVGCATKIIAFSYRPILGSDWGFRYSAEEHVSDHPDEGTSRRWASLRVAAAIGRAMK